MLKITALAVLLYGGWLWTFIPPKVNLPEWSKEEKVRVVTQMKFHGVESSFCEGKECYFVRKGKKCKL